LRLETIIARRAAAAHVDTFRIFDQLERKHGNRRADAALLARLLASIDPLAKPPHERRYL
jgi:hypothetical protein